MDLALNNLQRLICHKTQPTNQPASFVGWLVDFYGISTILRYLMPNPVYMYTKYIYDL